MTGRALVTGAGGFVGRALTELLHANGWEVCKAVREATTSSDEFTCDVRDGGQVEGLLDWAGPVSHVFHLAAVAFVPEANRDPVRAFDTNLNGTVRIAEAMVRRDLPARLVFISSSGVYGAPQRVPIDESHPLNPQNTYDISKAAAERYLTYLHKARGIDAISLRAFNHSGAGQSDDFVLSSFARQVAQIEAGQQDPVIRVGNVGVRRDFSHVDDVVRAYELAALQGQAGAVYNVCSGRSHRVQDALDVLLGMSSAPVRVEVDPQRLRAVEVEEVLGSHERLTADTGWQPRQSFEDILRDLLGYWRRQLVARTA